MWDFLRIEKLTIIKLFVKLRNRIRIQKYKRKEKIHKNWNKIKLRMVSNAQNFRDLYLLNMYTLLVSLNIIIVIQSYKSKEVVYLFGKDARLFRSGIGFETLDSFLLLLLFFSLVIDWINGDFIHHKYIYAIPSIIQQI